MTAVAAARFARRSRAGARTRPDPGNRSADMIAGSLFDDLAGEPTLDELLRGVWQGVIAHQRVPCPMCGGEMTPVYGAHARPLAGRCTDCDTTLE